MVQIEATKEVEVAQEAFLNIYNRFQEPITMTLEDLASNLLTPTEMKKCRVELHTVVLFKRWTFNYNKSTAEHWQKALGLNNPNAEWAFTDKFDWSKARKKIMRKYGFAEVNYVGKKINATGLRLKTVIINNDPEIHAKKVSDLVIAFKANTKDNVFLKHDPAKCMLQLGCSKETWELLKKYDLA